MTPDEIRALRERAGLTQRQFGNVLGVSHQTVINWEKGRTSPQEAQLAIMGRLRERLKNVRREEEKKNLVSSLITAAGLVGLSKVLDELFGEEQ